MLLRITKKSCECNIRNRTLTYYDKTNSTPEYMKLKKYEFSLRQKIVRINLKNVPIKKINYALDNG